MKSKSETLIGFAIKAQRVIYGLDFIEKNKNASLIIICKTLSQNSLKRVAALNKKTPVIISQKPLEQIVFKPNTKAIAITDKQMSKAILTNISNDFLPLDETACNVKD